jgi:hypothetical protein
MLNWFDFGFADIKTRLASRTQNLNICSVLNCNRLLFKKDDPIDCGNDPSAGSPTETLLRLQLPLDDKIQRALTKPALASQHHLQTFHRTIQSVAATGGVYKGQGRILRELMTRTY